MPSMILRGLAVVRHDEPFTAASTLEVKIAKQCRDQFDLVRVQPEPLADGRVRLHLMVFADRPDISTPERDMLAEVQRLFDECDFQYVVQPLRAMAVVADRLPWVRDSDPEPTRRAAWSYLKGDKG